MDNQLSDALEAYAAAFAALKPENLDQLAACVDADVYFQDPFNHKRGEADFIGIFEHMFEVMTDAHFEILDTAISNQAGYIKWRMGGTLKARPTFDMNLVGMSEVHFNAQGLVTAHIDHWDSASQLLVKIPVAGRLVRLLLGLFKH